PDLADRMVLQAALPHSRPFHSLFSDREFSVFERLAHGANVNDIAQQLALISNTISTNKERLMQKMKLNSQADLAKYAME
ncbi:LuxR C-terminal-related transcriptional regulator, partial [Pseudomonas syringae pv. tagetis]|uniref:response regulator transcription factor n=1 Tax=Pseudomonas syringae group genomosp. 7 TaxID=251699 RepID=UPI00376F6525